MKDVLRQLALRDGRFSPEAFHFLFDSLDTAIRLAGKQGAQGTERHVTGEEVLRGLFEHAKDSFGPLAATVWRAWGLEQALDWGRIVFLLVDEGHLKRQAGDTIEDFDRPFDFDAEFVHNYKPALPPDGVEDSQGGTIGPTGGP